MNSNEFLNIMYDPVLPDLLPEEPVYHEMFQIDDLLVSPPQPEITELSRQFELLTVDINTQGLRIEIERTKRQRLQASMKQMKRDLTVAHADIMSLRNEITQLRACQDSVNYYLENENARTNTLSFRSLSRIGQILSFAPDRIRPSEIEPEVETLLQELNNTIRQFGVYYMASYV